MDRLLISEGCFAIAVITLVFRVFFCSKGSINALSSTIMHYATSGLIGCGLLSMSVDETIGQVALLFVVVALTASFGASWKYRYFQLKPLPNDTL